MTSTCSKCGRKVSGALVVNEGPDGPCQVGDHNYLVDRVDPVPPVAQGI
jgi:hypothetical protein